MKVGIISPENPGWFIQDFRRNSTEAAAVSEAHVGEISLRWSDGPFLRVLPVLCMFLYLLIPFPASAKGAPRIQEITGHLEPGERLVYTLPKLKKGQILYARVLRTSGNLDPFLVLIRPGTDFTAVRQAFAEKLEQTIAAGGDPLVMIPEFAKRYNLVWNDDGGLGYGAELRFRIPQSGTYTVLLRSGFARDTFGGFRLILGLDAPKVLTGKARRTGARFAFLDRKESSATTAVQETKLTFSAQRPSTFFFLSPIEAGKTLYIYLEGAPNRPLPTFTLHDYGDKPVRNSQPGAKPGTAVLQYTFPENGLNYILRFNGRPDGGKVSSGTFRLLIGLDDPTVLTGEAAPKGRQILKQPIPVLIGFRLQQITNVDQRAENFGVVATLQMRWKDPALAFSPDTCQCTFKVFRDDAFGKFATTQHIPWPEFTIFNQQGNRWVQNRYVVVFPDGAAIYLERFSTTMQAPDFDFRHFPFDRQKFFIRIDNLYPQEFFRFQSMKEFNQVGTQLGEEEWLVIDSSTSVTSDMSSSLRPVSRFNFLFEAKRHLTYYIFRIFLPLFVIIAVSWIIFFSKDYAKRVDVAGTNLLIFVAFNFTISSDLPRLGYLTFMDSIIVSGFVVTSLVLIFNVIIRRLELTGMVGWVKKVDQYMLWIYPLFYIAAVMIVTIFFD
jgi:hypothetical protein